MIGPMPGAAIPGALDIINQGLAGQTISDAYDNLITGQYKTDNGPPIGYADYTGNTPAITGETSHSISDNEEPVAVDAWHDYVENEVTQVSKETGGIVSGSNVGTFAYSLLEENSGAPDNVKAVAAVAVKTEAAVVAVGQALGVSINIPEISQSIRESLVNAVKNTPGVIYDAAKDVVTCWKDSIGKILFPKSILDSIYQALEDLGIGGGSTGDSTDYVNPDVQNSTIQPVKTYESGHYVTPGGSNWYISVDDGFFVMWKTTSTGTARWLIISPTQGARLRTRTTPTGSWYNAATAGTLYNGYYYGYSSGGNQWGDMATQSSTVPDIIDVIVGGHIVTPGEYPQGTEASEAPSYTPSTIPSAGRIATSYDPDSGILGSEEVVPVQLTEDPYNSIGSTDDPTSPTDEDNPGVLNPPIPLPIPDTNVSNPDVPLVNPTVVDNALIQELVNELAETLDPQPAQSSGIVPVPPMPGILDPVTGESSYPSIVPASGSGLIHVYNPTTGEFVSFGNWLWVTYADATIDKIWNNPFDGIIGAHELYATPQTDGSDNIRSGFLVCPTTAALVRQRYTEIDCGTIIVPEFYGNYLDYSPYSQAYIYLPFIGINEVSIDDIAGHAVNVRYRVDAYNGSCIAMIFVAKDGYQNLCYQFAGNCAVEVPLAGGSQAAIKAGVMQAEAYARSSMIQAGANLFGGIGSALMGNLGGVLSSLGGIASAYGSAQAGMEAARVANKSSVQHSGQFGASHGAMGEKIPFIIIRNPIQVKVVNYNEDYGFPAHKRVIVGGCRGYLRVREVNVISAHATDDEKLAIEIALKNGVYVS